MNKKVLTLIGLILLIFVFSFAIVCAQVSVGVKVGDWVEYEGVLEQFDSETTAKTRIEIVTIQGNNVVMKETSKTDNGESVNMIEGAVGKDFLEGWIIPPNLGVGESFHEDGSFLNDEFVITISGTKNLECCGDTRQVVYSSDSQVEGMTSYWDVETGMLLEATRQTDSLNYHIEAVDLNLWTNLSEGSDYAIVIYGVGASVIAAVALGVFFLKIRK